MGFTWAAREVVPAMKGNSWGRIVTLGSLCAKEPHKDFPMALHNFGRPAQVGLSKTLANELGQFGITVNTIATGMLDHDGFAVARAYDRNLSAEEIYRLRIKDIPLKRTDTARELGDLCAFLCSERAAFLTGQTILLDGGRVGSLM
jgi:3-oxoacyl-[acyl-carrier protein] reductase